jgi:hypothetical protein
MRFLGFAGCVLVLAVGRAHGDQPATTNTREAARPPLRCDSTPAVPFAPGTHGLGIRGRGDDRVTVQQKVSVPSVTGPIDAQAVRRVIQEHADDVRRCYEQRLAVDPRLSGALSMRWVIDAAGQARTPCIVGGGATTLPDDEVGRCIMTGIAGWVFPKADPDRGGVAVVSYRWTFVTARPSTPALPQ